MDKTGLPQTQGEYMDDIYRIIMGDEEYPKYGYKPIDIMNRVIELLYKEKKLKEARKDRDYLVDKYLLKKDIEY